MSQNLIKNIKGQGSALSQDVPAIIMIVVSLMFFLSSLGYAMNEFNTKKADIQLQQAVTELSSVFMRKNAVIELDDLCPGEGGFFATQIEGKAAAYGVEVYVELEDLTTDPKQENLCKDGYGDVLFKPENNECCKTQKTKPKFLNIKHKVIKHFPVAIQKNDLEVHPGIIKVTIAK